jgi:uncharacterized membrane protein
MHIPCIVHIPFVLVFLGFALCFVLTQVAARRR